MATPRIDNIITEFGRRIAMQVTFTGTTLDDYDTKMTAQVFMSYINRAMLNLFNDEWRRVGGNKERFVEVFPELMKHSIDPNDTISFASPVTILGTPTLTWIKANPYKDIKTVISLINVTDSKRVQIQNPVMYGQIAEKRTPNYTATTLNQLATYSDDKLTLFCDSSATKDCSLVYIARPVSPSSGNLLVQDGTEDSPFSEDWTGPIAEIAEKLFKIDSQQTS